MTPKQANDYTAKIRSVLESQGLADSPLPDLFLTSYEDWTAADHELKKYGYVLEDRTGSMKANPASRIKGQALATMLRIISDCGLSPKTLKSERMPSEPDALDRLVNA